MIELFELFHSFGPLKLLCKVSLFLICFDSHKLYHFRSPFTGDECPGIAVVSLEVNKSRA